MTMAAGVVLVAVSQQDPWTDTAAQDTPVVQSADVAVPVAHVAAAAPVPRCFGAASMARKRCHNKALVGRLTPTPATARRDQTYYAGKQCYRSGTKQVRLNRGCTFGTRAKGRPHVILVGDSHARAILPALVPLAEAGHISLEAQMRGSCSWTRSKLKHSDKARIPYCNAWRKNLNRWLIRQASRTDVIVTTGYVRQIDGGRQSQIKGMRAAWKPLTKRGVRIVAISDNPRLTKEPQRCLRSKGVRKGTKACGVSTKNGLTRDPFLLAAKSTRGATAIDLRSRFCRKGHCPAVIGGVNVYRDYTHITHTYASTLAPVLTARFRSAKIIR